MVLKITTRMIFIFLLQFTMIQAQTYSTLQGGPWSSPSTWQNNVVPGAGDDVVIIGPVQLDAGGDYYVHSLKIEPNGDLTLVTNLPETRMHVAQDVTNEGTVEGKSYLTPLYFYIGGGIINYGQWKTYDIFFTDTLTHLLRAEPGSYFSPSAIWADSARIVSDRDAYLYGVNIKIKTLELRVDHATQEPTTFYFLNGSILQVQEILGQDNAIAGDADSYIHYFNNQRPTFNDIHIKGETITNARLTIKGKIVIDDTLRILNNLTSSLSATVSGDITNKGALLTNNHGYVIDWECSGNVRNEGVWDDHNLTLTGNVSHTLYTDLNTMFSPGYFYALDGTVVSDSSLRFDDIQVQIRKLVLQPGHDLYLQLNTTFMVDSLIGNHNNLYCNDASQLRYAPTSGSAPVYENINLFGTARLNTHIEFLNSVVVEGTLTQVDNYNNNRNVTVKGDIENKGSVSVNNWGYGLHFYIEGNLKNSGDWESGYVEFTGSETHHLFTDPAFMFSPGWLEAANSVVESDTTLRFDGGTIKIGVLNLNHDISLRSGATFRVDTLNGNGHTISGTGDSKLSARATNYSAALYRDIVFADTINIYSDLTIENFLTNNGLLKIRDNDNNTYQITVKGNIVNNGSVLPNNWNSLLRFGSTGDVENYGTWQAQAVELNGTQAQHVVISDTNNFQGELELYAMRSGNRYQWLKDGTPLSNTGNYSGVTYSTLTITQVGANEFGTYQCQIDSSGDTLYSRPVIITDSRLTAIAEDESPSTVPNDFQLLQNFPNPFNPVTTIRYLLPQQSQVLLVLYDITGRRVKTLVDGVQPPGAYSVQLDASGLSSGIYFYRIQAGTYTQTRKLVVQK